MAGLRTLPTGDSRRRRVLGALLAAVALTALTGCTTGSPSADQTTVATTAQPDIAGEWVVTRTVTASDDTSNPAHAVGAVSERFMLVEFDDCGSAVCPGTVSSGATLDARQEGEISQTKNGYGYTFEGALDCLDAATGGVMAVGGFAFSQEATLTVDEVSGKGDDATAVSLSGTLRHTDSITQDGLDDGCARTPPAVSVEYAVSAVRAS